MKNDNGKKFTLVQRVPFLKNLCKGKKVLHLGCTDHPYTDVVIKNDMLLHFELGKIAGEIYGFDYDQEGIDVLKSHGTKHLYLADLERLEEVPLDETFDVIIAGEMIEHLSNPGLFLKGIQRFMTAETKLVLTTINAYCGMRMLIYGFRGKGGANEPVHPDHVAYYSYSTLKLVVDRAGLNVEHFTFYDVGTEHRKVARWTHILANDISVRISPQWADGIIAVCRLKQLSTSA
ncbi:MAG: class I SAM-dependent methyltransferase [Pyrinomonadaceae bacterium]|nr:class I SAM-dependent methyltransferase [Pyrinomonadaceae bacterium]